MKAYHGNKWSGAEYDPVARRGKAGANIFYIMGGNKVAPTVRKTYPSGGGKAVYEQVGGPPKSTVASTTSTFSKVASSLATNGAAKAAPTTVKTIGAKGAGVDAAEVKKLKDQVAEL